MSNTTSTVPREWEPSREDLDALNAVSVDAGLWSRLQRQHPKACSKAASPEFFAALHIVLADGGGLS